MKVVLYRLIFIIIFCLILNLANVIFLNGRMPRIYMNILSVIIGVGAAIAFPLDKDDQ